MMYSISSYGRMILDQPRMDAYLQAFRHSIQPGAVVIDIGTGTGIHALMACQLGASKVYAIEPATAIHLAKQIAAANGYSDRIEFIQGISTKLTLPEQADVIISDLHGVMPWFAQHIPSLVDARQRLLKPGGILLPQKDTLWGGVVTAPELYQSYASPWNDAPYGFDLSAGLKVELNTWGRGRAHLEQFLTNPVQWAEVDYRTVEEPNLKAQVSWTVDRPGLAHGYMLWFDTLVTDGVPLTSAPYAPEIAYGSAFFPFLEPVDLQVGDRIELDIRADLISQDYMWTWHTQVTRSGLAQPLAEFKQSNFFSQTLDPQKLRKRVPSYVPSLSEDGQVDCSILQAMTQQLTVEQIAQKVAAQFPAQFPQGQDALDRVRDLAQIYG
ncbi:class I SAM-dependent methyltransferase [Nodosilinea sp. P-1105]|uniref:50S ribosomal protein L11 methyltransferase n=1 Tax=Nodosilinea sp. P-1105 TaxID=2546229 RepID=UPI00146E82B2|nr:class I SAM-dependent methyltransferase [Nodosilinea sp. P-1105]NMF83053.1 methyltransferase domain-containing protein [Nodosilinea sp. P-1105]